jgi:outer membrane protein OmpA-like peptidoglycan-associated protein
MFDLLLLNVYLAPAMLSPGSPAQTAAKVVATGGATVHRAARSRSTPLHRPASGRRPPVATLRRDDVPTAGEGRLAAGLVKGAGADGPAAVGEPTGPVAAVTGGEAGRDETGRPGDEERPEVGSDGADGAGAPGAAPPVIVYFERNRATLGPEARSKLDRLAIRLTGSRRRADVRITGHADQRGTEFLNDDLSSRRARRVADYLQLRGVDEARLEVRHLGERRPLITDRQSESIWRNRRVEIHLVQEE